MPTQEVLFYHTSVLSPISLHEPTPAPGSNPRAVWIAAL